MAGSDGIFVLSGIVHQQETKGTFGAHFANVASVSIIFFPRQYYYIQQRVGTALMRKKFHFGKGKPTPKKHQLIALFFYFQSIVYLYCTSQPLNLGTLNHDCCFFSNQTTFSITTARAIDRMNDPTPLVDIISSEKFLTWVKSAAWKW